jgi:hypothetical protein
MTPGAVRQAAGERLDLDERRGSARHRPALPADVRRRLRRREADRAGRERLRDECAHRRDLRVRRLALRRLLAHDVESHRRVADERADVDRGAAALDRDEELREALERPVRADPGPERVERHALDLLERAEHEVAVRGARRRDAEPAVPHHDRRDAVPRRDREHPVPEDLGVVVRVDVDEAGRDHRAVGVHDTLRTTGHLAERRDAAGTDADVAAPCGCAGAVDERAAADEEVVVLGHESLLTRPGGRATRVP